MAQDGLDVFMIETGILAGPLTSQIFPSVYLGGLSHTARLRRLLLQNRAENRGCPDTSVGLADDPAAAERCHAIESVCGRIDHSIWKTSFIMAKRSPG